VSTFDRDVPMLVARITIGQATTLRDQLDLAIREEPRPPPGTDSGRSDT
jgi:hypothetical protein